MKKMKRLLLGAAAVALAFALAGCSLREVATNIVVKIVGTQDDGEENAVSDTTATPGGSVTFPDGFDTTGRFNTLIQNDQLYISFNGISNKSTGYFNPQSGSVTISSYATTESTKPLQYKAALWQLSDDQSSTTYVPGTTIYFDTGKDCETYTVTGLDAAKQYKVVISYDSSYYITGGMQVSGIGSTSLNNVEGDSSSS